VSDRTAPPTVADLGREDLGDDHEPAALGAAETVQLRHEDVSRRARRRAAAEAFAQEQAAAATLPFEPTGIVHVFQAGGTTQVPLAQYVRSIWERRAFMVELAKADLRGTRSNTTLGRLWGVLDPLFMAAVYFFLFRVISGGRGRPFEFLPVLVAGVFLLSLTMGAMNEGGRSIKRSKYLLLNSSFPRAMLPAVSLYKGLLAFVPAIGVVALVYVVAGHDPGPELAYLPLLFLIQIVLNLGLSLLVATVVTLVRDASNVLNYVTRLLFFATPVIYPVDRLPEAAHNVLQWQPLFALFAAYQQVVSGEVPSLSLIAQSAAWAIVLLVLGAHVFRKHEHEFAMHL
jgi:ABC-type polysaccharide/polyol phosphate export permease